MEEQVGHDFELLAALDIQPSTVAGAEGICGSYGQVKACKARAGDKTEIGWPGALHGALNQPSSGIPTPSFPD